MRILNNMKKDESKKAKMLRWKDFKETALIAPSGPMVEA